MDLRNGSEFMDQVRNILNLRDTNVDNAICAAILELSYGWTAGESENQRYIASDFSEFMNKMGDSVSKIAEWFR